MADFAHEAIFEPLGMNDTRFLTDHTVIIRNRATGYSPDGEGGFYIDMTTLPMIGDGGVLTTINDIKKWNDAFYGSEVLGPKFWEMMTTKLTLNSGKERGYAAGLMVTNYRELPAIRHGGAFVGYRAELLRFPEQRLSIAIFANRSDAEPGKLANSVADILLADQLAPLPVAEAVAAPTTIAMGAELAPAATLGSYKIDAGLVMDVIMDGDSLRIIQNWDNDTYAIVRIKGNTFAAAGMAGLSFTFHSPDAATGLAGAVTVDSEGDVYEAARTDNSAVDINLEEYVGRYYSEELDIIYNITSDGERLKISLGNKLIESESLMMDTDEIGTDFGDIKFFREGERVAGFLLDLGRVSGLRFRRM